MIRKGGREERKKRETQLGKISGKKFRQGGVAFEFKPHFISILREKEGGKVKFVETTHNYHLITNLRIDCDVDMISFLWLFSLHLPTETNWLDNWE